jgi:hypothetical protein
MRLRSRKSDKGWRKVRKEFYGMAGRGTVSTSSKGRRIMRILRSALVVPVAVAAVALLSSPASASSVPTHLSIGQVRLGPLGASVSIRIRFTCDPTLNVAYGDASVTQVRGHKLGAQGSGSFTNSFPGVPCTGAAETVTMQANAFGSFAFKKGTAIASADLTVFDPVSGNLSTTSVIGQAVTIP